MNSIKNLKKVSGIFQHIKAMPTKKNVQNLFAKESGFSSVIIEQRRFASDTKKGDSGCDDIPVKKSGPVGISCKNEPVPVKPNDAMKNMKPKCSELKNMILINTNNMAIPKIKMSSHPKIILSELS